MRAFQRKQVFTTKKWSEDKPLEGYQLTKISRWEDSWPDRDNEYSLKLSFKKEGSKDKSVTHVYTHKWAGLSEFLKVHKEKYEVREMPVSTESPFAALEPEVEDAVSTNPHATKDEILKIIQDSEAYEEIEDDFDLTGEEAESIVMQMIDDELESDLDLGDEGEYEDEPPTEEKKFQAKSKGKANYTSEDLLEYIEKNQKDTDYQGLNWNNAQLPKAKFPSPAKFFGSNLMNTDLSGARLDLAEFGVAGQKPATLMNANLQGANLDNAELFKVNLSMANLKHASLKGAQLKGANLTDANLEGANLTDAFLSGAMLKDANLKDANLTDATLEGANLTDTNLTGATYNAATKWPTRFKPEQAGARLVEPEEEAAPPEEDKLKIEDSDLNTEAKEFLGKYNKAEAIKQLEKLLKAKDNWVTRAALWRPSREPNNPTEFKIPAKRLKSATLAQALFGKKVENKEALWVALGDVDEDLPNALLDDSHNLKVLQQLEKLWSSRWDPIAQAGGYKDKNGEYHKFNNSMGGDHTDFAFLKTANVNPYKEWYNHKTQVLRLLKSYGFPIKPEGALKSWWQKLTGKEPRKYEEQLARLLEPLIEQALKKEHND